MIKLTLDQSHLHKLTLLQYVRTHKYYLFMMLFKDKTVFFVRRTLDEVNQLDAGQGSKQSLLYDASDIYVLQRVDRVAKVKY